MKVAILQPMFLPWVGVFELIQSVDVFVHLDDAQYRKGYRFNRVQIKTAGGSRWLTVPVTNPTGLAIRDVVIDDSKPWRRTHLRTLQQSYAGCAFRAEMLALLERFLALETSSLCEWNVASVEAIADYFGLECRFETASSLGVSGAGSARVLEIVQRLGGTTYRTGDGARHYLDHDAFEAAGVQVEYLDYARAAYPQRHGAFDPHVSILDLVANCGRDGREVFVSPTRPWREHVDV